MRIDHYFSITFAIYDFLGKKRDKNRRAHTPTKTVNSEITIKLGSWGIYTVQ